jgi:hypothetical protein
LTTVNPELIDTCSEPCRGARRVHVQGIWNALNT